MSETTGQAPPQGSPPKISNEALFVVAVHLLIAAVLLSPLLLVPAVSATGRVTEAKEQILWFASGACLLLGAGLAAQVSLKIAKRRLLAVIAAVFALLYLVLFLIADLLVGAIAPLPTVGFTDRPKAEMYGWAFEPGDTVVVANPDDPDDVVQEPVNSAGWRDIDHDLEPENKRVLLLGDSQVYGTGLKLENTIGRQLDEMLGEEYDVVQMGQGGYGTAQQYLVLLNEGLDYQPDVVVLLFTMYNDVMDNMYPHAFLGTAPRPSYKLVDGNLMLQPIPETQEGFVRRLFGQSNIARHIRVFLRAQDVADGLGRPRTVSGFDGEQHVVVFDDFGQFENFDGDYAHRAVFREEYSPRLQEGWDLTLALIEAMNDAAEKSGAEFLLFANQQYPPDYTFEAISRGERIELDATRPFTRLFEWAEEQGIATIEEPLEVRERLAAGELSFVNDSHYNPEGARVAAELIAEKIQALAED